MELSRAIDAFGAGFTYTRSFTHPYEYVRVGHLRVMRDKPRKSGEYRVQEILVHGISAPLAVQEIRAYKPPKFFVCVIHEPEEDEAEIKNAYKLHGFRLLRREPMMVRETTNLEIRRCPFSIRRVLTEEDADRVKELAGRQILPADLHEGDAHLRLFAALDSDRAVGLVRSVRADSDSTWVSNMFVDAQYRRRGLGSALMTTMLADDAQYGFKWSVLLASTLGTKLYESLGYRKIGMLQLFAPDKHRWA
jgi:GNAT superfamily N-acetyltransferase